MSIDTPAPAPYGARVLATLALVIGLVETCLGLLAWVDAAQTTGDAAEWAGLGYLLALLLGVPGAVALLLGAGSLAAGRNVTVAYVTAAIGTAAALGPVLLVAYWVV